MARKAFLKHLTTSDIFSRVHIMKATIPIPYLTIEETATTLRVSERTVRRWIARGALTVRKFGGTVRVPREVVVGGQTALPIRRRGRRLKMAAISVSALSDGVFAKTWDNAEDAVYDRWREIYGVRKR